MTETPEQRAASKDLYDQLAAWRRQLIIQLGRGATSQMLALMDGELAEARRLIAVEFDKRSQRQP